MLYSDSDFQSVCFTFNITKQKAFRMRTKRVLGISDNKFRCGSWNVNFSQIQ